MKKADLHLFWIATIRDFSHEIPTLLAKNSRYLSDSEGPAFASDTSNTTRTFPIVHDSTRTDFDRHLEEKV
jgi:hypothetical protein